MRTALITLATGEVYRKYANEMIASAKQHWPEACPIVFTDNPLQIHETDACVYTEAKGYPGETLMRYHTFLKSEALLSKFDYIMYCDADMKWVAHPGDEIYGEGLTATLHPGYYGRKGTPEMREESMLYCPDNTAYYCGGFQGGRTESYLSAAKWMASAIDHDARKGITPLWHDESAWNKYLTVVLPTTILSPSYCYPEDYSGQWGWAPSDFKPILVALNKKKRDNHWSREWRHNFITSQQPI